MKQTLFIYFNLLLLSILVTGCQEYRKLEDVLRQSEMLLETSPDSAYTLLESIGSKTFKTKKGNAHYALLYSQALDKCYIDETNDSLINIAMNYYRHHGAVRYRFLSAYYKGRIHFNAGDYLNAMLAYSEAESLIPEMKDDYYIGLLYTQLGIIYKYYSDYSKSIDAYKKAYEHYGKADKKRHQAYALWNQANVCWQKNDYEKSIHLYTSVLSEAIQLKDSNLEEIALGELFMIYMEQDSIQKAHNIYNKLENNYELQNTSAKFWGVVAEFHAKEGKYTDIGSYLQKGWNNTKSIDDSISLYFIEAHLSNIIGNYSEAYIKLSKGIQMQTGNLHGILQQPILSVQRDYLANKLAFITYRRNVEKVIWTILFVVLLTIVIVVIIHFRKKMQQKNEFIRHYIEEITEIKLTIEHETSEKSMQLQELFKEQFKVIDMLGESFTRIIDEKRHQKDVYKQVQLLLDKYDKNNRFYFQLEEFVDRYNDNAMQKLRTDIEFPENTYRQLCYHIAGFSVNVISLFMKEPPSTIYKRRTRALNKITSSESQNKEILYRLVRN